MNLGEKLGEQIKGIRKSRGFSQRKLARLCDVEGGTISKAEKSVAHTSWNLFINICEVLECELHLSETHRFQTDNLTLSLLNIARPLAEIQRKPRVLSSELYLVTFAQLVGSVITLIQCAHLIKTKPDLPSYQIDHLFPDLEDMIRKRGLIDWKYSPNIHMWSVGFFLNAAQGNIARIIDRCITTWLSAKLSDKGEELKTHSTNTNLPKLKSLISHNPAKKKIEDLMHSLHKFRNGQTANQWIRELSDRFTASFPSNVSLERTFEEISSSIQEIDCASAIFRRSGGKLTRFRSGLVYEVEWAITARAVLWTGEFLGVAIADVFP